MNFSTFDIEKIKKIKGNKSGANDSSVSWYSHHNRNRGTSVTASPELKHLNRGKGNAVNEIGQIWDDLVAEREAAGMRKMQGNSVRGVEVMLGASQEFFKKNKEGEWQVDKDWAKKSKEWAEDYYKGKAKLAQWDLTRDERGGPKLKMIFAPINDETKSFNANKMVGNKQDIKRAQQSYAALMKNHFDLTPPTKGSKVKNNKKVDSEISEETRLANKEARVAENKRIAEEEKLKQINENIAKKKEVSEQMDAVIGNKQTERNDVVGEIKDLKAKLTEAIGLEDIIKSVEKKFASLMHKLDMIFIDIKPHLGTHAEKIENASKEELIEIANIVEDLEPIKEQMERRNRPRM